MIGLRHADCSCDVRASGRCLGQGLRKQSMLTDSMQSLAAVATKLAFMLSRAGVLLKIALCSRRALPVFASDTGDRIAHT